MKHTLERADNSKGYTKDNCVWLPKSLQVRNQRNTKLTIEIAREIRSAYARGDVTYRALAQQYGVASSLIGVIVKGRKWVEFER